MTNENIASTQPVSIREGLLGKSDNSSEYNCLLGSRCVKCGEVGLGSRTVCANCGHKEMDVFPLASTGKLWTYTVIRHQPPGAYRGPQPFKPFGVGLVELPDGIRVLSVIECEVDELQVGMDLKLEIYALYQNDAGEDVMTFRFKPYEEEK